MTTTQEYLDAWLRDLLNGRADKSWEPTIYASADVVDDIIELGGYKLLLDESLPPGTVSVFGDLPVIDVAGKTTDKFEMQEAARYSGAVIEKAE